MYLASICHIDSNNNQTSNILHHLSMTSQTKSSPSLSVDTMLRVFSREMMHARLDYKRASVRDKIYS